jgi:hypothetical protein
MNADQEKWRHSLDTPFELITKHILSSLPYFTHTFPPHFKTHNAVITINTYPPDFIEAMNLSQHLNNMFLESLFFHFDNLQLKLVKLNYPSSFS